MLKKVFYSFFVLMLVCKTFSAESSANSDSLAESIKKVKANYASHPAAKPIEGSTHNFAAIPSDILVRVSSFLDLKSCLSYLLTCKRVQSQGEPILVFQLPNMYAHRGLNYTEVFFSFSHPQWTPDKLPTDVTLALHKWFLIGSKLKKASIEPLRSFKLLYSAGCLGHKFAAYEAGEMLLKSEFNGIIPVTIKYKDLELNVRQWDICRLNQQITTTPELEEIVGKMGAISDAMETSSPQEIEKSLASLSQQLSEINEETDEKKVISILLEEVLEHYKKHKNMEGGEPTKTIKFVKELGYTTPFLNHLLQNVPEESESKLTTKLADISEFHGILNCEFLSDYLHKFEPVIYDIETLKDSTPFNTHVKLKQKYTPEAREAVKSLIGMQRIAILLGNSYGTIAPLPSWFNPESELEAFANATEEFKRLDAPINIFLSHLLLTRLLSASILKIDALGSIRHGFLVNYMNDSNSARFELLEKKLSELSKTSPKS